MTRQNSCKRFTTTALTTLLCVAGIYYSTVAAAQANVVEVAPIDIPFEATSDRASMMPAELEQVDSPLGEESRAIVGQDERYPVLSRQYPWSAMGRLEWRIAENVIPMCTATLIGPSSVLTNAHCLMDGEHLITPEEYAQLLTASEGQSKLVFETSMVDGQSLGEATVVSYEMGWTPSDESPLDDWAVLQLDQPLGNLYGYIGWRNVDFANPSVVESALEKISLLGYSGDFPTANLQEWGVPMETAGIDLACSVLGVWPEGTIIDNSAVGGILAHDCDTSYGASGGPMIAKFTDEQYYLVGLHARRTYVEEVLLPDGTATDVINGAVPVSRWADAVRRSRDSL